MEGLLGPKTQRREYESESRYFERLALLEEAKGLPGNAVWKYFCMTSGIPVGEDYIADIQKYETAATSRR